MGLSHITFYSTPNGSHPLNMLFMGIGFLLLMWTILMLIIKITSPNSGIKDTRTRFAKRFDFFSFMDQE